MPEDKGDKSGETKPENQDGGNGNSPDGGNNSGDKTTEPKGDKDSIREMVREEIAEALKGLKPEDGTPTPRRNDIEAAAERMVREASERIKSQEDHQRDHEQLRAGNQPPKPDEKTEPESAPKKVRKLTKILWGDAD